MKYINIISVFTLIAGLFMASCEDALDVAPNSNLESNYFENEDRVQRGIGAIYAEVTNIYGPNLGSTRLAKGKTLHPLWLLNADDLTNSGTSNAAYEAFSGFSASDGRVSHLWRIYYVLINRANFMLEKLNEPEVVKVYETPHLNDYNKGEALFLKSWAYYQLWDKFRKAPLMSDRVGSIDEAILQPGEEFQMLDSAIAMLHRASELLPESWDMQNKGRVFKNSAYGMLVKAYTLRANYAGQYAGGDQMGDYQKAISAFEKISGESTIEGVHFGHNFDYRTENNPESLFEFQASHNQKEDNSWLDNDFGGEAGFMGAFYHYFSSYWGNYGSGGGSIGPSPKLVSMFDEADPRRNETFMMAEEVDNVDGKLWWLGNSWDRFDGYQFVKYINGPRGDIYDRNWQNTSGNNQRILRLADVKLFVAEAYLQTGQVSKALEQVNDVRERARFSTEDGTEAAFPADYTSIDMQKIMDERMLELAGEDGIRWTDLKRWHAAGFIDLGAWSAADFGYPNEPELFDFDVNKHMLYPIPAEEMDANPNIKAVGNNPGYN